MLSWLKTKILIILGLMVLVQSCRKDKTVPQEPPIPGDTTEVDSGIICEDFPVSPEIGFVYTSTGPQYKAPCFNPNNSNEFVFIRTGISGTELVKYDIIQGVESVLTSSASIITQPQWGSQGWIIFNVFGNTIWKIHESGSGLEQIVDFPSLRPCFDNTGGNFISMAGDANLTVGYRPIFDLSGNLVDSIYSGYDDRIIGYPYFTSHLKFSKGYFAFADHAYSDPIRIGVCHYEDSSIVEIGSWFYDKEMLDITANSEFVYVSTYWRDLIKINLVSHTLETFKEGCQTKFYNHIDVSPDGTKMIAQVVISTPYDNDEAIDEQNEIWLIDLVSGEESVVLGEE